MTSWALLAAFLSGLAWAGLDIARKSLARDLTPSVVATGLALGAAVLFGGWAALSSPTLQPAPYIWPAAISTVLSVGIQLMIVESVRRSELSRTIPLLSFTPVATALSGAVILGELPSPVQWFGIFLVFVGALGLGLSRRERGPSRSWRHGLLFDTGGLLMLGAAVLISIAAPFDKLAVAASSTPVHGFFQSLGSGLLLLAFLGLRGEAARVSRAFRARPVLAVAVLLALAAVGFQFAAYRGAMVGAVETIKRVVGLVSSLAAGYLVFGEKVTASKLIAVAFMALGVALMLG
jgi:drug/metabolite transporter (DMT)-like permease